MAMTASVQYFVEARAEQHNPHAAERLLKLATVTVYERQDGRAGCSVPLQRVKAAPAQIASDCPPAAARPRLALRE